MGSVNPEPFLAKALSKEKWPNFKDEAARLFTKHPYLAKGNPATEVFASPAADFRELEALASERPNALMNYSYGPSISIKETVDLLNEFNFEDAFYPIEFDDFASGLDQYKRMSFRSLVEHLLSATNADYNFPSQLHVNDFHSILVQMVNVFPEEVLNHLLSSSGNTPRSALTDGDIAVGDTAVELLFVKRPSSRAKGLTTKNGLLHTFASAKNLIDLSDKFWVLNSSDAPATLFDHHEVLAVTSASPVTDAHLAKTIFDGFQTLEEEAFFSSNPDYDYYEYEEEYANHPLTIKALLEKTVASLKALNINS